MTNISEKTPEQYRQTIQQFLLAYWSRRKWEVEQAFLGIIVPMTTPDLINNSALADQLAEIARAAAGEIENDAEGWNRGIVYEGIQDLMERLFAPPGLGSAYDIPARFWDTDLGQMVARALIWVQDDELITLKQAADLRGVTIQAISNAVREGRLRRYTDPDAPNPRQGGTLVSRSQVEAID